MSKYFELITEILGWLQIVASPFFVAVIIGVFIYFPNQTLTNLIISIVICLIKLIGGIIFATKKFKSEKGTISFLSRTRATSELDKSDEENS